MKVAEVLKATGKDVELKLLKDADEDILEHVLGTAGHLMYNGERLDILLEERFIDVAIDLLKQLKAHELDQLKAEFWFESLHAFKYKTLLFRPEGGHGGTLFAVIETMIKLKHHRHPIADNKKISAVISLRDHFGDFRMANDVHYDPKIDIDLKRFFPAFFEAFTPSHIGNNA